MNDQKPPDAPFEELHLRARELVRAGSLPTRAEDKMYAGNGSGAACSLCSLPIGRDDVEYEVGFAGGTRTVRFHLACHAIWDFERQRVGQAT